MDGTFTLNCIDCNKLGIAIEKSYKELIGIETHITQDSQNVEPKNASIQI